jgi:uncharacterized membrane protein required for colicin V production
MGLDLALGTIILFAAIRGWLKGFVSQSVRLAGFVASFYLADPIREQARPFALAKLPTIDPGLVDRMLWWVSVVISYVVLVGLTTLAMQMMRTPPAKGMQSTARNDQFAGFMLGVAKGLLIAAFLAAGVQKFATNLVPKATWVHNQTEGSWALKWTDQYQPVPKIWATSPVRSFVAHIQRNGFPPTTNTEVSSQVAERISDEADGFPPRLDIPSPDSTDFYPEDLKDLDEIKADLHARGLVP